VRKLGELPGLTRKISNKQNNSRTTWSIKIKITKKHVSLCIKTIRKTKITFHYNITERQLLRVMPPAKKLTGSTGSFASTFRNAVRQYCLSFRYGTNNCRCSSIVGHGHILVNQNKVDIPSYSCSVKISFLLKIKSF
jgi:small subunit ribosomal protein S4